jgi:enamine deaminase RidA (YjgF/YER057c/UK114 family)
MTTDGHLDFDQPYTQQVVAADVPDGPPLNSSLGPNNATSHALNMNIERWGTGTKGRNHTVADSRTVWTVSNARNLAGDFVAQVNETLEFLDASLKQAESSRERLLSVQVILSSIADRDQFNSIWCKWVGDNPAHWPQRVVFAATLAPGLLVEVSAVAQRN